jgi:ketosteroid isomerase-like protein
MISNRVLAFLVTGGFLIALHTVAFAQEFSSAQKEVWRNVQTYLELERKQDLEGFMSYFHERYRGWPSGSALPIDKASARELISHDMATTKVLVERAQPVAIEIHGNVAFVDYYLSQVIKDADGKEKTETERWTDILMKEGDKWLMVGDHGGETSNP